MTIEICVGSACRVKGSEKIVSLFRQALGKAGGGAQVALSGSLCAGKCSRDGVTVTVDGEAYSGITPMNFKTFFNDKVLPRLG